MEGYHVLNKILLAGYLVWSSGLACILNKILLAGYLVWSSGLACTKQDNASWLPSMI